MALHREHTRLVIELLGNLSADALHLAAAAASGGVGFVMNFRARQVGWQGRAFGLFLLPLLCRGRRQALDLL
jgi:hypothetical protein